MKIELIKNWHVPVKKVFSGGTEGYEIQKDHDGEVVAEFIYEKEDAILMAAAPDLLAALQKVYRLAKQIGLAEYLDFEEHDYIGEAINKALS